MNAAQQELDSLGHLEERITRAVDLVVSLRAEKSGLESQLAAAIAELAPAQALVANVVAANHSRALALLALLLAYMNAPDWPRIIPWRAYRTQAEYTSMRRRDRAYRLFDRIPEYRDAAQFQPTAQ